MHNQSLSSVLLDVKARFPQLNGRVERAGNIVQRGLVQKAGHNRWHVVSQADYEQTYTVTFDLFWRCDCQDCQGSGYHPAPICELGGSIQPVCKHILAVFVDWLTTPPAVDPDFGYIPTRPTAEYQRLLSQEMARRQANHYSADM